MEVDVVSKICQRYGRGTKCSSLQKKKFTLQNMTFSSIKLFWVPYGERTNGHVSGTPFGTPSALRDKTRKEGKGVYGFKDVSNFSKCRIHSCEII